MEFSQFKSKYQRSLRSMFSLTKDWTLASTQKQVFLSSLNIWMIYREYFLFHWKLFCFAIKKNYLFQLITFKEISQFFAQKNYFLFFKNVKNSRSTLMLFLNIPFILSFIISEIFESIIKKTIYLYRFFLLLSIPVLIFCVNKTLVLDNKNNHLSFIIPESKKLVFDEKNPLYIKKLRKIIFTNHILTFLSEKLKTLNSQKKELSSLVEQKISYLSYLPNIYQQFPLKEPLRQRVLGGPELQEKKLNKLFFIQKVPNNNSQTSNKATKWTEQKSEIFFKWLSVYINLKKKYSINLQNNGTSRETKFQNLDQWSYAHKEIRKSNLNLNSLEFFEHVSFFTLEPCGAKKNSFLKEEFFQKIDTFFFSLLKPRDLSYLNHKKLFSFEDTTNCYQYKNIDKNGNLLESLNKQQWIITIRQWVEFYPSQDKFILLFKNKKKLKENFQSFQSLKLVIEFFQKFFQIFFEKLLLNRANLFSIFINNQQPSFFISYKNALNFKKLNFENSIFLLRNQNNNLEYLKFFINQKIIQKMNFLYTSLYNFGNDYFFINSDSFFLIQKNAKLFSFRDPLPLSVPEGGQGVPEGRKKTFQSFLNVNHINFDLDFYLKKNKPNDSLFWIPSSSLQKNFLEQENKKQNLNGVFAEEPILSSSNQTSDFSSFQQDFKLIKKKREKLQNIIHAKKFNLHFLKKYNRWIFTPQYWLFRKDGIVTEMQFIFEDVNNITQILLHRIRAKINLANKKKFIFIQHLNKVPNIFVFPVEGWNKLLNGRIYASRQEKLLWINLKLLTSVNNSSWSFFTWFITSSIVYYHWLPMFTGVIYLYLWLDFEKIRSLSYPSWNTFLSILTHNSVDSPSQQVRLAGYLSKGKMLLIYSLLYRFTSEVFFVFNRINYITTLDLYRRNKNLVSNSFITKNTLRSKYYFWNINNQKVYSLEGKMGTLNGFTFFQKWYEKNFRISSFLQRNVFKSFSLNWLNDLFFYNRFLLSSCTNKSNFIFTNYKSKPIPLSEPVTYTQRWLFIGSLESGKSFVIKNLAASTHYPLIHISIKDIKKYQTDIKNTKIKKQKTWVEQLSARSFLLENILNLAKIVAPSFFWISDLHDFDTKNQIQEKKTQKFNISLLMATLLKMLSSDFLPEGENHITFIGSTEYPRLLDPKFVSRQRLDLIINFRTPSFNQRKSIFTFLLKTKGFIIKGLHSFYDLNYNTLGYTFRDITSLVNETLLIKATENTTLIDRNTIRLALYRQTSTQSVKYKTIQQENLQYKIGKALVQAIVVYPKSLILLSKYQDLWKTKFYYLSNTYLEVSNKKTITTEFVLLTQILNCLAGSAARDAWLLVTKDKTDLDSKDLSTLALTSQLKHDFLIASNILQSILVEFPMPDITSLSPQKKKYREKILKTFHFPFLKRAMSYLEFFDPFPSYINWSIKGKRLSFNWILFFSGIEHSTKNLARSFFEGPNNKSMVSTVLDKRIDINIPYERRETKRQQQKIQKIDSLFNKMIYTTYIENLGFPWESEYVMDYNPFQFSLFFREARPLWNPQTIMPSYSILFFDRDLLINQKLLTKLYLTYVNKFQLEKLNRKRIKKQFFWSNSTFNKVDLNKKTERKTDAADYQILPHGTHWSDFHFYQNLLNLNAQLDQSQIKLPVYLHQSWITGDPNKTFQTFDILSTKILVNNQHLIYKESFLFEILLEIYHYLLNIFIKKKYIMFYIKENLINNEIFYREDIESAMKKYY